MRPALAARSVSVRAIRTARLRFISPTIFLAIQFMNLADYFS
jgi:hypothetical protein